MLAGRCLEARKAPSKGNEPHEPTPNSIENEFLNVSTLLFLEIDYCEFEEVFVTMGLSCPEKKQLVGVLVSTTNCGRKRYLLLGLFLTTYRCVGWYCCVADKETGGDSQKYKENEDNNGVTVVLDVVYGPFLYMIKNLSHDLEGKIAFLNAVVFEAFITSKHEELFCRRERYNGAIRREILANVAKFEDCSEKKQLPFKQKVTFLKF
ncbi:hypothetical protein CRE_17233 [Caenorhabditis remanei]|uniref:Uncharacterized protein n=1 Tax=Caenorhabditis remanei TaxID=31234 RepID=E3MA83_CAERE|nr:hypothetical protein CRE_17233 [Caenorhabditis remanei]